MKKMQLQLPILQLKKTIRLVPVRFESKINQTLVSGNVIIKGNLKLNKDQKEKFIQEGNQTVLQIQSGAIELNANKAILLVD